MHASKTPIPGLRAAGEGALADEASASRTGANGSPAPRDQTVEPRIMAAWRQWLNALAWDADAAIAAAHVYAELPAEGRDAWLDALAEDSPRLSVSPVAVYAPLLSVEEEPSRRERIARSMGDEIAPISTRNTAALRGVGNDRSRLAVLVAPSYLDFSQALWVRYSPFEGFLWVRHEPIVKSSDVPHAGVVVEGVSLEATPIKVVVEELAHAILAQRRRGEEMHPSLSAFAGLFDACIDDEPE